MKTTNAEGGMRDSNNNLSIMRASNLKTTCCACLPCITNSNQDRNESFINTTTDDPKKSSKVLPNSNLDMWLKYLLLNLNEINDLNWVQYLLRDI